MIKDFVDKIPNNSRIAIFGAGNAGKGLKNYIDVNRKDVKILYFFDSYAQGQVDGISIINSADINEYKNEFDLLLVATTKDLHELIIYFEFLNINYIHINRMIEEYFRHPDWFSGLEKAITIFKTEEDKNLYRKLWEVRLTNYFSITEQHAQKYNIDFRNGISYNNNFQYLEYINFDEIKTVFDCGFLNGINSLCFYKKFRNLKNYYAFEPIYENVKIESFDKFVKKLGFNIVPLGVWKEKTTLLFTATTYWKGATRVIENIDKLSPHETLTKIDTTTIDDYKKEQNIEKIDFIKMDIEGSELPALEGAIKTLKEDRPQLAISIYHSNEDFIKIPIFLHNNLENYIFKLAHYSARAHETILYAIPNELY